MLDSRPHPCIESAGATLVAWGTGGGITAVMCGRGHVLTPCEDRVCYPTSIVTVPGPLLVHPFFEGSSNGICLVREHLAHGARVRKCFLMKGCSFSGEVLAI